MGQDHASPGEYLRQVLGVFIFMNVKAMRSRLVLLNKESEELARKLEIIDTVGWRAVCYGDDYHYGGYTNYLTKEYGREAKGRAELVVSGSDNGGHVERIIRGHEKPKGRVR